MRILALSSESHDAGLALLEDGLPLMILEEERLNRVKHTNRFPFRSLAATLGRDRSALRDIAAITTPWDVVTMRRTFFGALLGRLPDSLHLARDSANPMCDGRILAINQCIWLGLQRHFGPTAVPPIVNVPHHHAHAAIYLVSPFDEAAIAVMDGFGDASAVSAYAGSGNRIERLWGGRFFESLGILYTLLTQHLGFNLFEEGTVMALAATGDTGMVEPMRRLVRLEPDGRFSFDMSYFDFDRYGQIQPFTQRFHDTFGPSRSTGAPLTDHHRAIAKGLQTVTEDVALHVIRHLATIHPSRNLVLTGGVALNCVANARILADTPYRRVWVPPCASDTGAPFGSALWHSHMTLGLPRRHELTHPFYGLDYDDEAIERALTAAGLAYQRLDDARLLETVARDLAADRIVGWFQGRFEMGPRALGNRSILASPVNPAIRDIINARIKYREPFRPFAPAVLAARASEWFEISQPDPFMTVAPRVRSDKVERIPSAVHVDGTARIQTVERAANPRYHDLIAEFERLTGVPVLLNTSFNKQEPIVARPEEAISCYLRTEMDVLVLGSFYTTDRNAAAIERARAAFRVNARNTRGGE